MSFASAVNINNESQIFLTSIRLLELVRYSSHTCHVQFGKKKTHAIFFFQTEMSNDVRHYSDSNEFRI